MSAARLLISAAVVVIVAGSALAGPEFGREASPEEIAARDIGVAPDGATLPAGSVAAVS
ncbi:MAG: hypothetical protein QF926_14435 [Alphaproteobacteria bacterium]|nr:hypothetical protein [Alphaproteobacteria bacterium]MDP6517799.1 hypothetical protein [Alphaproteobacteria bacterium]